LVFTDEQRQRLERIRKQHREFHRRKRLAAQYDAFAASMAREQAELEAEAAHRAVDITRFNDPPETQENSAPRVEASRDLLCKRIAQSPKSHQGRR
jgi:hypothetical protein